MKKIQGVEVASADTVPLECGIEKVAKESTAGRYIARKVVAHGLVIPEFKDLSLGEILEEVDRFFGVISASIDGMVVEHDWFLYPTDTTPWYMDKLGIDGYTIGSLVKVCSGSKVSISTNKPQYNELSDKLSSASNDFFDNNGWFIPDAAKPRQFLLTGDVTVQPVLVDIEPRVETATYPPASIDLL
jgi:hypothetical protein